MADLVETQQPVSATAEPARPNGALAWIRHQVLTRLAASAWWLVMVFFDLLIIVQWIGVARDPSWLSAAVALGITIVAGIPILHEWPNARRMGRMLFHGT